jgi:rhamnulokinase
MDMRAFAAVDLGASGGRVVAGRVGPETLALDTVHRFPNAPAESDGHLRWDVTTLLAEVDTGLARLARAHPEVESIGIDTWAVDYGLLDAEGRLLAEPVAHRDDRTAEVIDDVHAAVPPDELFAVNGLQFLPFTTIYQLAAEQRGPLWAKAAHAVLLPDLVVHRLTGVLATERTNASTTGLLDCRTGDWSADLCTRLGLPVDLFPPVDGPGRVRGPVTEAVRDRLGLPRRAVVTTVGSHDTASAVVGVPATTSHFAYVSSGTWSLVGLELADPVLTPEARAAGFTNEAGVDGRVRFLRNVGGLWLLQESLRTWTAAGLALDEQQLVADAARLPAGGPIVDVDDSAFIPPGAMPERIAAAVAHAGGRPPASPVETVRCVLDSLASGYARTVHHAADLTGRRVDVLHVVGGGSRNSLLCQLTADATGLPVVAGPAEATALGNVAVQARAHGALPSSLEAIRATIAAGSRLRRYDPR